MPTSKVLKFLLAVALSITPTTGSSSADEVKTIWVQDESGERIAGACIRIKGTTISIYSSINGQFKIPAEIIKSDLKAEVLCVSYRTQEISFRKLKSPLILISR